MRAVLALLLALAGTVCQAAPLISKGDVTVEQVGSCDEAITLQVNSPNGDYFTGQAVALQKLLGGARMALSFQCPGFKQINVQGVAAGTQVYTGKMAAASGWHLEGDATTPVTETPSVAGQPTQPEIAQELPTPNCEKPSTSSAKVCCARHELCEEFGFKRPKQGAPVVNTRPTTPPPTPTPTAPPADPTALAGTGTVTIDGETQSFTVKQCDRYIHRSTEIVDIWSPDATVYFKFQETRFPPGSRASAEQKLRLSLLGYSYPLDTIRRKLTSGVWEDSWSRPTPGPLYHIDGLTLTAGATFNNPVTGKDTVMEFSVNCAEWHCPGGRFGCEYIEYTDRVAPAAETPEPTQEPDKGTMTVDGETRSFVVKNCSLIPLDGGNYKIQGYAIGDARAALRINLAMGHGSISVKEGGQYPKYVAPRDATAAVYRVDGSTVTVDGIFDNKRGGTKHSIQMSFDCSG